MNKSETVLIRGIFTFTSSCLCRITLAIIGLSWLVIGTTLVGFLPENRYGASTVHSFGDCLGEAQTEHVHLFQCEVLAERSCPPDLLQDLCPGAVGHHPLPQQVSPLHRFLSSASCRALPVDLNTCFFLQREPTSERRDLRG